VATRATRRSDSSKAAAIASSTRLSARFIIH
jgi:hypothetical protein